MGDISEIRGLIVVGTFLAVTVLMIGWIPGQFYTAGAMRTIEPEKGFEGADLAHINITKTFKLNSDFEWVPGLQRWELFWGKSEFGHDLQTFVYQTAGKYYIHNIHGYRLFGFWSGGHSQEWINDEGISRGIDLSETEITLDWDADANLAKYTLRCKHFYMTTYFAYNTTYSNIHDAWNANDVYLLLGIGWDQRGTVWDAWSIIAGVLFFQLPEVNVYLIALISIPLWIAIAYISYILVLRATGAVFGGGGA